MDSERDTRRRNGTPEPDSGLGATADPMAFGAALAGLGKRLAREPALVAGTALRLAAGLAELGAVVAGARRSAPPRPARFRSTSRMHASPTPPGSRTPASTACASATCSGRGDEGARRRAERRRARRQGGVRRRPDWSTRSHRPTSCIGNPAALKRAFETGGSSVARGFTRFVDDVVTNGGWPRQVDTGALELGEDLAATPGKVVYRNRLMELIQFAPRTETVFETPLLLSPPWINKYYVMDLAPGKSFAEWAIDQGHTVFCISYRNPDESFRDIGFEDYLREGPLEALDVIGEITGAKQVNVASLCLGATLTAVMLGASREDEGRPRARCAPRRS